MGLHPAERIREYREKGYWTDDMIDALFRARVAEFGDIPAVVDPLNRDTLTDGPARTLTWPRVDDEVSRLAQVLLDEGVSAGDASASSCPTRSRLSSRSSRSSGSARSWPRSRSSTVLTS